MVQDYINYFRSLAIAHKDLQHNPASETGDGPVGSIHFTKTSPEQVLKALPSGIGFPVMAIELYETEMQSQAVSEIKPITHGGFMVVDTPVSASAADEDACFIKCEKIVYDILKKIYQDVCAPGVDECQAPFKDFDFDKLSITPVSRIFSGRQSGYRVVFGMELQNELDITEPPEAGTFL